MQLLESIKQAFGYGKQTSKSEQIARVNTGAGALAYFEGRAPEQLKNAQYNDNIFINYARLVVDKVVTFLFGEPVKISVGSDAKDKTGEEYLNRAWTDATRAVQMADAAYDGAIHGTAYLKVSIDTNGLPRVSVPDPSAMTIVTDEHDADTVTAYICEYAVESANGKYLHRETTRRVDSGGWLIETEHSFDNGKSWVLVDSTDWNLELCPYAHAKNLPNPKNTYGRPDLSGDVLKVISALSRIDSLCAKVVRVHSSPKPYARGIKKSDVEFGTENMMFLNSIGKDVLPDIGLLEMSGDLAGALALRKTLREGLAEMTRVPEIATGKVEHTGGLSGVALRILYSPLLDLTMVKRRHYGLMIEHIARVVLAVGGFDDETIELHWADPLPSNELETLQAAEAKRRLRISEETLHRELGYDPELERERNQVTSADTGRELLSAFDRGVLPDDKLLSA